MKRAHEEKSDVPEKELENPSTADVPTEDEQHVTKKEENKQPEEVPEKKKACLENADTEEEESDRDSDSDSFVGPARPADLDDNQNEEEEEESRMKEEEPFQLRFVPRSQRTTIPQQQQPYPYQRIAREEQVPQAETKQDKNSAEKAKPKPKKLMFKGDRKKQEEEEWKHRVKEMKASELLDMRCKKKSDRHCY